MDKVDESVKSEFHSQKLELDHDKAAAFKSAADEFAAQNETVDQSADSLVKQSSSEIPDAIASLIRSEKGASEEVILC